MLRDRGTIKWTAMMLPEHVELLKEIWKEDDNDLPKTMDEQTHSEWDQLLHQATKGNSPLKIEYILNHSICTKVGIPTYLDPSKEIVRIRSDDQQVTNIPISSIQSLSLCTNYNE